MTGKSEQKNGKIEFLRFVFCVMIIFYHIDRYCFNNGLKFTGNITVFINGYIGVEFFFLVTGYLMASSCYKERDQQMALGKSTVIFVGHKWISVLPFHIIAFSITFIEIVIMQGMGIGSIIVRFIQSLPNLFLIQTTGIYTNNVLTLEWYLAVMLLALLVLYPLCKKNYDVFTRIIAPLVGVFLVGYLSYKYGLLSGIDDWDVICMKTQLRAIAEICLGAFSFEVARFLRRYDYKKSFRTILTAIEIMCYLVTIVYSCLDVASKYEAYVLYALMLGVCLTFSDLTYGKVLFQNKVIYFLGSISLTMYLCQNFVRYLVQYLVKYCFPGSPAVIQIFAILIGDFILSVIVWNIGKRIVHKMRNIFDRLTQKDV